VDSRGPPPVSITLSCTGGTGVGCAAKNPVAVFMGCSGGSDC
jgi:hypothetical protein